MSEVVLICGSRDWSDEAPIREFIQALEPESLVVHGDGPGRGGNPGADRLAGWIAEQEGHHVAPISAFWSRYGKSAGPRRNRAMALLAPVLSRAAAFPLPGSKGTWGMVELLDAAEVSVDVYDRGELVPLHDLFDRPQ